MKAWKWSFGLIFALSLATAVVVANSKSENSSSRTDTSILGVVRECKFYKNADEGPGGKELFVFVLIPDRDVDARSLEQSLEDYASELQIVFDIEKISFKDFESKYLNKRVEADGELFSADNIHHHTKTLVSISSIKGIGEK